MKKIFLAAMVATAMAVLLTLAAVSVGQAKTLGPESTLRAERLRCE